MNRSQVGRWLIVWLVVIGTCGRLRAQQTNSWTGSTSGNWQDSTWSLGVPPGTGQSILVANHGWKAVAIGPVTASNFPDTMTIDALSVTSPGTDTVNTVLFNYAGFQTPFVTQSLNVSNDAQVVVLGSVLNVQYGKLLVDGGAVTEDAASQVSAGSLQIQNGGRFDLASGTLTLTNHGQETLVGGQFHQEGGSNLCDAFLDQGEYDLSSGDLTVRGGITYVSININGNFIQSGGTVVGDIGVGQTGTAGGHYEMSGGTLQSPILYLPAPSSGVTPDESYFVQTGGTNYSTNMDVGSIYVQYGEYPWFGSGYYTLTNGLLVTSSLAINGRGGFAQSGGAHTNGTISTTETQFLHQEQPGGNSYVYNQLGYYVLSGGTLVSGLVDMEPGNFTQSDGSAQITTLQMGGGQCRLSGGQLSVSNIVLSGGANFVQTGGTVTQSGALVLVDAGFTAGPGPQQFGELQLGTAGNTNSTFTLSPGACALHFANSSSLVWSNSARLIITNWNGSPAGGGSQQIFFGSNNSGLTSQQLSQVQFLNPAGLPIGTYSARILSSGEVVPDQNQGQGSPPSGTVNSWISSTSGNWQDAASWSLGLPPASSQSVMLTNAGFKAVSIQSSTASGFPQTLAVNSVTIASPTNSLNTLLMNFVGAGSPLVIGVDSNTPGSLIISDTNSAMAMFSSGLIVNNALGANNSHLGEFEVDGTFTQSDGSEVVAGFLNLTGTGSYNMTNGELFVGTQFINGKFHQQGGSNLGSVIFTGGGGEYDLFSGSLKGGVELDAPLGGRFIQSGGTNTGGLGLDGPGIYQLSGGLLVPGDLSVGPPDLSPSSLGAGTVEQTGGTNNAGNITMGVGNYDLEGGVLTALNLTLPTVSDRFGSFGSSFNQSGGYFSSGGVDMNGVYDTRNGLQPATYTLSGGELITPAINLTMGRINQTGGTNNVGVMTLNTVSSYVLNGGVLIASNLTQNGQTAFSLVGSIQQSGGTNEVMDVLYVGGGSSYDFTNGLLIADNIQVAGQAMFVHAGGSFGGMDNIVLAGGGWVERTAGEQLGQLQLGAGTNSSLNLPSGSCALRFADSSSVPWSNDGRLTIQGWSGSLNGGGAQQIFFGTTGSGLIAQQLSQILFSDPAGLPTGTYTAQILSTGEIVPDQNSSTSGPVDSWIKSTSGNWDDASAWSLGTLPNSFESVLIANSGSKAVAINPSTSVNFPDSMTVTNLFIRGATNTENTLLLNNFGTTVPFTVLDGMILQDGAQILNLNSGLVVQGGAIEVTNSQINQDGGFFIATNTAMALNDSFFNLTNGVFACGSVSLGYPTSSHFNQYGGTAIITNLSFASYLTAGIPNGISLYGGTLDLPGGMDMYGEPGGANYFQSGGTNRTGQVNIEVDYGGFNPNFTLNGGLLADSGVLLYSGYHAPLSIMQSGGTHTITNTLLIKGSSANGYSSDPATYNLSGGALAAGSIELDANDGDSVFVQTNGNTSAGTVYTHSVGYFSSHNTIVDLLGGSLNCSNYTTVDGGGQLNQSGGALVVSNLLDFGGTRDVGITLYGRYTFTGGTLTASNINISGDWMIGDGSSNRISNPGVFSLSHLLQINDAVEQLGHFVLASNATIDLAGSSSRLSFANSSSQTWAIGATLVVTNWNGDPSGGGVEQLKFGSGPSGLTPAQLNQIQFSIGTNLYPAKILASGEVVPNQTSAPTAGFSTQGNNFVVTWPAGWTLQSATNASGPYNDVPAAVSPYTNDMTLAPRRFFRLRQ